MHTASRLSVDTVSGRCLRNGSSVTFAEWLPVKRKQTTISHFNLFFSTEIFFLLNNEYVLTLKEGSW